LAGTRAISLGSGSARRVREQTIWRDDMRAYIREIAAGLITAVMALPLVSETGATGRSDNMQALGLAVAGSPGTTAGMMVAIPVGGDDQEHAKKPNRRQLRPRHPAP
jgi:hypothetical protein